MQTKIRVSAIIVTMNAEKYIHKLLRSLLHQKYLYEIVIVDNNSNDKTIKIAKSFMNSHNNIKFKILNTGKNAGYPSSVNIGINESTGNYILTLNDDTYLDEKFIENAIKGFGANKKVGFIGGKILRFDKKTIDTTGQFLSLSLYPKERGYDTLDEGQYSSPTPIFSVCGAVALYKKEFLEDTKLSDGEYLDDDYFLFFDDIDLCWRGNKKGWKGYYIPNAVAFHERSSTSGAIKKRLLFFKRPAFIKYHYIKNRYMTLIKNATTKDILLRFPFIFARDSALLLLTLLSSPKTIYLLLKNIGFIKKAIEKRKIIEKGEK